MYSLLSLPCHGHPSGGNQGYLFYTGRDPFNQNSNRSDRENWSASKGGPVFSKLFLLDRNFRKVWLNRSRPGFPMGRGEKSQISRDFQRQIREKISRFRGIFFEIFRVNFAKKQSIKYGRLQGYLLGKCREKLIGFTII